MARESPEPLVLDDKARFIKRLDEYKKQRDEYFKEAKLRFLIAIGKVQDNSVRMYVMDNVEVPIPIPCMFAKPNWLWDDSDLRSDKVTKSELNLNKYLSCAKKIFDTFLDDKMNDSLNESYAYAMRHARDYRDPNRNMIDFEEIKPMKNSALYVHKPFERLHIRNDSSAYVRNLNELFQCFADCTATESTFIKLNVNVTYILLLLAGRMATSDKEMTTFMRKTKTNEDYNRLCPYPLGKLPDIAEKFNRDLHVRLRVQWQLTTKFSILYAYHTRESLRELLDATCMERIKYNGLGLIKLFWQAVRVLNVDESDLWNAILCNHTQSELTDISSLYVGQYLGSKNEGKTYVMFPYCRFLHDSYHPNLSSRENFASTYILSYLIDLKLGLSESSLRNAKSLKPISEPVKENIKNFAIKALDKLMEGKRT